MRILIGVLLGLVAVWIQITTVPHLSVFGIKPNLLLISVLLLGLRWVHPWVFVYAAVAGLAQDAFSHGLLGIYGVSFLAAAVLANVAGRLVFEQNLLVIGLIVVVLSWSEGLVALVLLDVYTGDVNWVSWYFGRVILQGIYHALLTPVVQFGMGRLERWMPAV